MSIEEKLLAVITENLPQAHIGILKDYLNRAAENEQHVTKLNKLKDELFVSNNKLHSENRELNEQIDKLREENNTLKQREADVAKQKRELDLTMSRLEYQSMQRERDTLIRLSEIVFRNPRLVFEETRTEKHSAPQLGNSYFQQETGRTEVTKRTVQSED